MDELWSHIITAVVTLVIGSGATGGIIWQWLRYRQQAQADERKAQAEERKDDREWASDTYRDMVDRQEKKISNLQISLDSAKEERMKLLAENIDLKAELNRWKAITHQERPDTPSSPPAAPPTSTFYS